MHPKRKNLSISLIKIVGLSILLTNLSLAKEKTDQSSTEMPLWELGFGFFWAKFPDYPGSDFNYKIALPFPSAIYRGNFLRAKRDEGVRARFINHKRFELDISYDGTLPSRKSKKNLRRSGMPDLDAVLEIGPKLIIHALRIGAHKLDLNLALRYGFSTDLKNWKDRGVQLNPFLTYQYNLSFQKDSFFQLGFSSKWSSKKLLNYYYGVNQEFATNTRPFYEANSGLLEHSLSSFIHLSLFKKVMGFAGVIKGFYKKAANRESPLLVKDQTTSVVLGIYLLPWKSEISVID